jgi:toxin HigB-1
MIKSFRDKSTKAVLDYERVNKFSNFQRVALRKLLIVDKAESLNDLKSLPGNQLEKLCGSRKGQYSIRINIKWRICFDWRNSNAYNVEICDYH